MRKRFDQLTKQEIQKYLQSTEGLKRLVKLQEEHLGKVKSQILSILDQIRDIENNATSWVSLIIVLGVLQLFQQNENYLPFYFLMNIPSFSLAFFSAALTLSGHPNLVRKDFFTPEEADLHLRYKSAKEQNDVLEKVHLSLQKKYEEKLKFKKYLPFSIMTNFATNIIFLATVAFFKNWMHMEIALIFGITSLIIILVSPKISSYTKTYTRKFSNQT